ncbi:MAG: methylmalonyl-CoA epimerase [Acidobacteria bacterium]|nr:methylmalonyl-CoA epimerase [Acidobacteriota bacterium]
MITALDHIAIAVVSIEEARTFYENLGLSVAGIEEVEHEGVRVAMIPCGGSRIELLEPLSEDSPVARFLERRGPGIHHLCLKSDDIDADDCSLREDGVELLREQPGPGAEGATVQFVHPRSAGGVLVELSEPAGSRS